MAENVEETSIKRNFTCILDVTALLLLVGVMSFGAISMDALFNNMSVAVFIMHLITFAVLFSFYKMEFFRNNYKAHIVLFVLYQVGLGLNFTVTLMILSFCQSGYISDTSNILLVFFAILYNAMNILNHSQLIYWTIYKTKEESLWRTAIMKAPFRTALYIIYYAMPIVAVAKSVLRFEDQFSWLHLAIIICTYYCFSSNEGKVAMIKTKFTAFFQKYELKFNIKHLSYMGYAWLFGRCVSMLFDHIDLFLFREGMGIKLSSAMQMLLSLLIAQDYFLKFQMDYIHNFKPELSFDFKQEHLRGKQKTDETVNIAENEEDEIDEFDFYELENDESDFIFIRRTSRTSRKQPKFDKQL